MGTREAIQGPENSLFLFSDEPVPESANGESKSCPSGSKLVSFFVYRLSSVACKHHLERCRIHGLPKGTPKGQSLNSAERSSAQA